MKPIPTKQAIFDERRPLELVPARKPTVPSSRNGSARLCAGTSSSESLKKKSCTVSDLHAARKITPASSTQEPPHKKQRVAPSSGSSDRKPPMKNAAATFLDPEHPLVVLDSNSPLPRPDTNPGLGASVRGRSPAAVQSRSNKPSQTLTPARAETSAFASSPRKGKGKARAAPTDENTPLTPLKATSKAPASRTPDGNVRGTSKGEKRKRVDDSDSD